MNKESLVDLYTKHQGKVSDKWSFYLNEYDRLLYQFRDQEVSILEIGIQNGGSLEIWSKYFKNASLIVGVDVDDKCKDLDYDDPRIKVIIGDVNDQDTLNEIYLLSSQFSIIIDDGSHLSNDIIKSFVHLFPYLSHQGIFIVEDLHCSYWKQFDGGLFSPYSSIAFFKNLVDVINFEHWGIEENRESIISNILERSGTTINSKILTEIHSIEFTNSLCIIRKSTQNESLGYHFIAGSNEAIVEGRLALHGLSYELNLYAQRDNYWSMLESSQDQLFKKIQSMLLQAQVTQTKLDRLINELSDTEHKLSDTEHKLSDTEHKLSDTEHKLSDTEHKAIKLETEINSLKNSKSWKITYPLRMLFKLYKSWFHLH